MTNLSVYTIWHSIRPIEDLIRLLETERIQMVFDVQSMPGSSKHPQYNQLALRKTLANPNIGYVHLKELNGYRGKSKMNVDTLNPFWKNRSFRNYADYALTNDEFKAGIGYLCKISETTVSVVCVRRLFGGHVTDA